MAEKLSEQDEITLRTMAMIERTTVAEQRRKVLRAYAKRARRSKNVADLVTIQIGWAERRRQQEAERSNVLEFRRRHG